MTDLFDDILFDAPLFEEEAVKPHEHCAKGFPCSLPYGRMSCGMGAAMG